MEQLSPWATTAEPVLEGLCAATTEAHTSGERASQQEKPPQWQVHRQQQEQPPPGTTRESLCKATKIQHSQKKKEVLKKEIACLKNAYSVIRYWVLIKYKPLDHQIECNGLLQSSCMPTSLRYENFYWSLFNRQVNTGLLKQSCKQRRKTNILGFPYLLI